MWPGALLDATYMFSAVQHLTSAHTPSLLITAVYPLQKHAMQVLAAIVPLCLSPPLVRLVLSSPEAAHREAGSSVPPLDAAQLRPLAALQQLPALELLGLSSLGPGVARALRQLTGLTYLRLAREAAGGDHASFGSGRCADVFRAASALTRLQELSVTGSTGSSVVELPEEMSRLTRLRRLQVREISIMRTSHVLTALTALQLLDLRRESELHIHGPMPLNPLPPGMHALRSLRELRVTCNHQPVPPLALPALTVLELDAPSFFAEVRQQSIVELPPPARSGQPFHTVVE